jgi:hypothetical protein
MPNLQTLELNVHLGIMLNADFLHSIDDHPQISKITSSVPVDLSAAEIQSTLAGITQNLPTLSSKVLLFQQVLCSPAEENLVILQDFCNLGLQISNLKLSKTSEVPASPNWGQLTIRGLEGLYLHYPVDTSETLQGFIARHPALWRITFSSRLESHQIQGTVWSSFSALANLVHCCEDSGRTIVHATFRRNLGGSGSSFGFACHTLSIVSPGSEADMKSDFKQLSETCPVLHTLSISINDHRPSVWILDDSAVSVCMFKALNDYTKLITTGSANPSCIFSWNNEKSHHTLSILAPGI